MKALALLCFVLAAGCNPQPATDGPQPPEAVATSGKKQVPVADVPAPILEAVKARNPDFRIATAESETREGRNYFDVGGTLPDGSEIEFDVMEEGGRWRVVEAQRDIGFSLAPEAVRTAALAHNPGLTPSRVIESGQADGIVIYELFAPQGDDPQGRKIEVKWDGRQAVVLTEEWAH